MKKCPTCARTYTDLWTSCSVDGANLYDPEALNSYIRNLPPPNTWQTSFWHTFRVLGLPIVALLMIGIGLLLPDGNKPNPICTIIAFALTLAFLFAIPIFFIVTVIRLFSMPLEDKLKTLSIIFAAISFAVLFFSIVESIYFDQIAVFIPTKVVAIIICLSLSTVSWLIGKRFESNPSPSELQSKEEEEEREELIRSIGEAISKNSKVGGWRK